MKLIISLVTFNGEKYLKDCLESIKNQTFSDFECVVLDNNSKDSSREIIKKTFPESKLIQSDTNLGFAKGHNRIINETQSQYVLCVNQDQTLASDYCEKLVLFLDSHPEVGSATGKIWQVSSLTKSEKHTTLYSCGIVIKRNHYAGNIDSLRFTKISQKTGEVFGVAGTTPIYRRTALESIKFENEYFDEDFFMYREDIDLAYRLRWSGWKAYFISDAQCYHVGSTEPELLKRTNPFVNYCSYRNNFFLLYKNVSTLVFWKCFFRIVWFEWGKFVYILFCEPRNLRGLLEFKKMLPRMKKKREWIMIHRKISDEEMYQLLK